MAGTKKILTLLERIAELHPELVEVLLGKLNDGELVFPDPDRERAYLAENRLMACCGGPIADEFPGMDVLEDIDHEDEGELIASCALLWEMVTDFAKAIRASDTWRTRLPGKYDYDDVDVNPAAGGTSCGNVAGIEIAREHAPHRLVLCHEMAHVLNARLARAHLLRVGIGAVGNPPYGHGAEWAGLYIALVRGMLGEVAADCLTAAFWKNGVPVTPDPWNEVRTNIEEREAA